jgi:hypothetical protein
MAASWFLVDAPLIALRARAETTARRSTVFQMQDLKDITMHDLHNEPTPAAIDRILAWRKHLNSLRPCVVLAVDFLSDRIETHVFLDRAVNRRGMLALTQIWCNSLMSRRSGGLEANQAFRDRTSGVSPA